MGAGIGAAGFTIVNWGTMSKIAASWVISPVLGGIIAAIFLAFINAFIIYQDDKIAGAKKVGSSPRCDYGRRLRRLSDAEGIKTGLETRTMDDHRCRYCSGCNNLSGSKTVYRPPGDRHGEPKQIDLEPCSPYRSSVPPHCFRSRTDRTMSRMPLARWQPLSPPPHRVRSQRKSPSPSGSCVSVRSVFPSGWPCLAPASFEWSAIR